jgi:ADP-ribose pyrophosphatase YjhB (NUDIX family)
MDRPRKPKNLRAPIKLGKKFYGRIFDTPGLVKIEGILSSYYGVDSITQILYTLPDDHYIICPLYSAGDFQIGVTGGFDDDEKWTSATSREMAEEIGLYPNPTIRFAIGESKKEEYYGKTWYVSEIKVENTNFVCKEEDDMEVKISGKSPKKIACLVHGTQARMETYAKKCNIYRYKSGDALVGVVFVQVKEAKELVKYYYR